MSPTRVLVVDDDLGTREIVAVALNHRGYDAVTAPCGDAAMELVVRLHPGVAVIDLRLPDMSGVDLLRRIRDAGFHMAAIMITGFGTIGSVKEAMRLGVADYLEKPVDVDVLIESISSAVSAQAIAAGECVSHASERWAAIVVAGVGSPSDPKTLTAWGRAVGVSAGAIKNWCRTAGIPVRESLQFARVLRAVARQQHDVPASELLDVVDLRTLRKLLALGTPARVSRCELPRDVEEFLSTQRWIPHARALEEVRRLLRTSRSRKVDQNDRWPKGRPG